MRLFVQNFVDLAGSERVSPALSAGARLKEGCHINRSLLTLGGVIRKLRFNSFSIYSREGLICINVHSASCLYI